MGYLQQKSRQVPFTDERSAPPQNYSLAVEDYSRQQSHSQSLYGVAGWELHFGVVDAAFPGLGYHMVTIGDGIGRRAAKADSNTSPWGARVSTTYSPGSSVIAAVDIRNPDNVVLIAGVPATDFGDEDVFAQFAQLGPITSVNQDPIFEAFKACDSMGWIYSTDAGLPIDNLDTDWRVSNALGGHIICSPSSIGLVVDEVTFIRANTIEQEVEISGRKLDVRADGVELFTPISTITTFRLGGGLRLLEEVEVTTSEFDSSLAETDNDFVYQFSSEPILIFSYYAYGLESGYVESSIGPRILLGGAVDAFSTESSGLSSSGELRFLDYGPSAGEPLSGWLVQPAETSQSSRDAAIDALKQWSEADFPTHFHRPLTRLAKLGAEFLVCSDHFIHLEEIQEGDEGIKQAISDNESVYSAPEGVRIDDVFHGAKAGSLPISAVVQRMDDGSIFIGNELGAGIRISGTTVFIEGASIRAAVSKDIALVARDVQVLANRNATIQANSHGRFYSGINLNLISGVSGIGGTLIESRGSNIEFELPASAEDAIFAGITARSPLSHVTLQGGDVVLDAGVRGTGALLLASKSSHILMSAAGTISSWCSANLMLYGRNEFQPSAASVFTQAAADLCGQLKASHAWFDGSVSARGNIQSVYGQMGDSDGIFGRVEETSWFEQGLEQFQASKTAVSSSYLEFVKQLKSRLIDEPGVLSQQIRPNLAGGFISTSKAQEHFGTANMQTSVARVFQRDFGVGDKPLYSLNVTYRDGGSGAEATYGWPGNTAEIEVAVPSTMESIYKSLKAMLDGQSPNVPQVTKEPLSISLATFV